MIFQLSHKTITRKKDAADRLLCSEEIATITK